ncbi:MAG TPA: SDR family oxidoreductase [Ktedonobacteraceae bacterium]|nr:SDR family oxidoreductase [Ktedonobacteraceae bacterium]
MTNRRCKPLHLFPVFKEEQIPLKRIGTPEEVADVVAFLLAHEARYINGQKILIDGGEFMW